MTHYFTDNAEMSHDRRVISFRFLGIDYRFITDNGVFSKRDVDYGTSLLLTVLSQNRLGKKIVDLGCGYGAIAIILRNLTDGQLTAVDSNSRAVELTLLNAELNGAKLEALLSDGLSMIDKMFDTVVTNPPIRAGKAVVHRFFQEAYDHLEANGYLWVVIRKQQGADSASRKIKEIFGNCAVISSKKGYVVLNACKSLTL